MIIFNVHKFPHLLLYGMYITVKHNPFTDYIIIYKCWLLCSMSCSQDQLLNHQIKVDTFSDCAVNCLVNDPNGYITLLLNKIKFKD